MTETLEQDPVTTSVTPSSSGKHRPSRVYQAAAWVAIVAGGVFIISAIFFAGFTLGGHGPGGFGGHHPGHGEMGSRSAPLMPGMRPGGPMDRPEGPPPGSAAPGMRPETPPQPPSQQPAPRP